MCLYRRLYANACVLSAVAGGGYGTYKGTEAAIYNYSQKELSKFELVFENLCGCIIITGYSFLWSMIGMSTFVLLPIVVPVYGYREVKTLMSNTDEHIEPVEQKDMNER